MHRMPIHQSRFDLCAGAIANIDQQRPQFSTFPVREMREGEP
jgi:nitrite reductase/ring-hydroxylating ferredoxin subunit